MRVGRPLLKGDQHRITALSDPSLPLPERTAVARAEAALAEVEAVHAEVETLRHRLRDAELRAERAFAESRRCAAEADRARRAEASALAQAERMADEWSSLLARTSPLAPPASDPAGGDPAAALREG